MALLLGVGYGVYHLQVQVLLIAAAVCAGLVGWRLGYSWEEMQQGIVESIRKAMPAILILLCVGMLVAAWIACGTIPMLLYYGLKLVSPRFFLVTACAVCSITSLATGTSWGTVGTVGVAFIGIAQALQVPLGPAAGAIVAGAYFGDKLSPFSDIPNLAPIATGANLFDNIRHMLWSAVPAWLAGLAIYFFMGLNYGRAGVAAPQIAAIMAGLRGHFHFHVALLLPLVIVFWFAFAKKPVIPGMMLSVAAAAGAGRLAAAASRRRPGAFPELRLQGRDRPRRRRPPDLARRHHEHDGDAAHRPGRLQLRRHHAAHRHARRGRWSG